MFITILAIFVLVLILAKWLSAIVEAKMAMTRDKQAHNKKVWDAYGVCNAAQNSIIEQLGNEKLRPRQRLRLQQALDEQFNIEAALDASMKK